MYKERETIVSGRYNSVTVAAACTANCQKLLDYVNNFYVSWLKGLVGCNFFNDRVNLRASQNYYMNTLPPFLFLRCTPTDIMHRKSSTTCPDNCAWIHSHCQCLSHRKNWDHMIINSVSSWVSALSKLGDVCRRVCRECKWGFHFFTQILRNTPIVSCIELYPALEKKKKHPPQYTFKTFL